MHRALTLTRSAAVRNKLADGVLKMLPLQHRFIHQAASVSFDLPSRPQTLTPNANLSLTTTYAVQNAALSRHPLTKDGSPPHVALSHMLRGELGEDPRALMALDPLSLPPDAALVAATLAEAAAAGGAGPGGGGRGGGGGGGARPFGGGGGGPPRRRPRRAGRRRAPRRAGG